jgi:hypothetical protein
MTNLQSSARLESRPNVEKPPKKVIGTLPPAVHFTFQVLLRRGLVSMMEMIENWSLRIGHLSSKEHWHDAPANLGALVAVCGPYRQGGGRAAGGPQPGNGLEIANDQFSIERFDILKRSFANRSQPKM